MKIALTCLAIAAATQLRGSGTLHSDEQHSGEQHSVEQHSDEQNSDEQNSVEQHLVQIPGLGAVQGRDGLRKETHGKVSMYLGIPFAKPPTGLLRWKSPQPHDGWTESVASLNATDFGDRCMQVIRSEVFTFETPMSEACLFLNIATPKFAANKKLPVMVFIHGGAYTSGQSNSYAIDSLVVNSNDTVVAVSVNYRLNVFGFLASKALQDSNNTMTGNYGIEDQRLALKWVKQHIGAFGGDGNDVTIFGESAGGNSVINHLAQPASFTPVPLYSKAIIESGAYNTGARSLVEASKQYSTLLRTTSCANLGCLRGLDASQLLQHTLGAMAAVRKLSTWGPAVDGVALTDTPINLIASKQYNNQVPVIVGSNRDEVAFFFLRPPTKALAPANMNFLEYELTMRTELHQLGSGERLTKLNRIYSPAHYEYPDDLGGFSLWWWKAMRITTDQVPGLGPCGVRWLSRLLEAGGTPAVYGYFFEHPTQAVLSSPPIPGTGPGSVVVPHGSEVPYVFGDTGALQPGEEADLARAMSRYWTAFAVHGKPTPTPKPKPKLLSTRASEEGSGSGLLPEWPEWPEYVTEGDALDTDTVIGFDVAYANGGRGRGIHSIKGLRKAACDYHQESHNAHLSTSLGLLS